MKSIQKQNINLKHSTLEHNVKYQKNGGSRLGYQQLCYSSNDKFQIAILNNR